MVVRLRTILVFFMIFAIVYFIVKLVSFYWLVVFFNIILIFINSIFLFAYFEIKKPKKFFFDEWPSVSVVIPNYNGAKTVKACIEAVKKLDYPLKKEIIVVDDGSKDDSLGIISKIKGIKIISFKKNRGKSAALNAGIKIAKGELVVTIDSDTYPSSDCLMKMVPYFGEGVGAVTGFVKAHNARNFIQKIQEIEYLISFGFFQSVLSDINAIFVTPGPMSIYRKDVLRKIGGFDENNITEDMEIAFRLRKYGYKIVACTEAFIFTEVPCTIKQLFKQRVRWYRGKFANTLIYKNMLFNPKYGEFGLFTFPFSVIVEWCIVLFIFVFVAGNIDGFVNYLSYVFSYLQLSNVNAFALLPVFTGFNPNLFFYIIGGVFYSVFIYLSHLLAGDNLRLSKLPEITLFLLVYGLFILVVFFVGFYKEINSSEKIW